MWIFGIDMEVQNRIGAAGYGVYFAVFNFSFLFHMLLDLGINQYNNREIAIEPKKLPAMFGQLLYLKFGLSLLYFLVTFLAAALLGFDVLQFKYLVFLAINQLLITLIFFSRSNFTALQWYGWDTLFSILDRTLAILFCGILLYLPFWSEKFELLHFLYAQTLALFIAAILAMAVMAWKGGLKFPSFQPNKALPLLKASLPFALVVLLMTIYTRVDAVMIERLLPENGAYEAGVYAAGYRLLDAINMIPFLIASILIPVFAKHQRSRNEAHLVLYAANKLFFALTIGVTIIVVFFGKSLLFQLYPQATKAWYLTFSILLLSFNATCFNYLYGGFLTANNRMKLIGFLAVFALSLNVVLNAFWIPAYGSAGAAIATIITQGFMALAQIGTVLYKEKLQWSLKNFFKVMVYALILLISAWLMKQNCDILYLNIAVITLIGITLAFVLQLIEWKSVNIIQESKIDINNES